MLLASVDGSAAGASPFGGGPELLGTLRHLRPVESFQILDVGFCVCGRLERREKDDRLSRVVERNRDYRNAGTFRDVVESGPPFRHFFSSPLDRKSVV